MKLATLIKDTRTANSWSQKQLAGMIGATPGFVTKLETGQALPSYERCITLANALQLSVDHLWALVEEDRATVARQRLFTRQAAIQGALGTQQRPSGQSAAPSAPGGSVEDLARELSADPDLQTAYRNLKQELADPQMRPHVLATLDAFARTVRPRP
jgi:transcriptional regulator with XRE-family HTH domain